MKVPSLKDLPSIKKLKEIKNCTFTFTEKELDGKYIANILVKGTNEKLELLPGVEILKCILPAYDEFKEFDKIEIDSSLEILDEAFTYLYQFLKANLDFKMKNLANVFIYRIYS